MVIWSVLALRERPAERQAVCYINFHFRMTSGGCNEYLLCILGVIFIVMSDLSVNDNYFVINDLFWLLWHLTFESV